MPTEVWVALITAAGIVVGYFIRPIGELTGEIVRDRRAKGQRRVQFQLETPLAISEALEKSAIASATLGAGGRAALERIGVLTFRVRDEALRRHLERFVASDGVQARAEVVARLGEVLREL